MLADGLLPDRFFTRFTRGAKGNRMCHLLISISNPSNIAKAILETLAPLSSCNDQRLRKHSLVLSSSPQGTALGQSHDRNITVLQTFPMAFSSTAFWGWDSSCLI